MNVTKTFATSLLFVIFLYLASVAITFLVPGYADAPFSEATPRMFFGWMWYATFSLVRFVTTWGPILLICVPGVILDIIIKLISGVWNKIPVLSSLLYFDYPGVTFQNSIQTILAINDDFYAKILSLGAQLEWEGASASGYWVDQGAGLLGGLGYFASNIDDIALAIAEGIIKAAQDIADDLIAAAQGVYDLVLADAVVEGQKIIDNAIVAGQTAYDLILADAVVEGQKIVDAAIAAGQEAADHIINVAITKAQNIADLISGKIAEIQDRYDRAVKNPVNALYHIAIALALLLQLLVDIGLEIAKMKED